MEKGLDLVQFGGVRTIKCYVKYIEVGVIVLQDKFRRGNSAIYNWGLKTLRSAPHITGGSLSRKMVSALENDLNTLKYMCTGGQMTDPYFHVEGDSFRP